MFEDTQSVNLNPVDVSLVDTIQSSNTVVTTVAEVAKKAKKTNVITIVNSLSNLTDAEIGDTRPSTIRSLNEEVARINAKYQEFLKGV